MGDPQAMRIMMLQARLGRRINEILMLDADPLLPLPAGPAAAPEPGAMTARLRYQQTKIDGAPDTILVDAEIVAIIRAQQEWATTWLREHAAPGARPRYLFLGLLFNRNADRPYVAATLHKALTEPARRLDIRDGAGRLVDFRRTHRFRHTKATSLQMSRVASAASFGSLCECRLPGVAGHGPSCEQDVGLARHAL
jgi:hypothetical protein